MGPGVVGAHRSVHVRGNIEPVEESDGGQLAVKVDGRCRFAIDFEAVRAMVEGPGRDAGLGPASQASGRAQAVSVQLVDVERGSDELPFAARGR